MGAIIFCRDAYGANAEEAFQHAYNDAIYENGHDSYSGDINVKEGFELCEVPTEVKMEIWVDALSKSKLPKKLEKYNNEFNNQSSIYNDKSGPALCFEAPDDAKEGLKRYIFVGWASY